MDSELNLKDEVVLAYSGGTDSTLAAVYLLKEFKKVTLLTIRPHNFLFFRNKAKKLADRLKEKYGSKRISHKFYDARELYAKIREGGELFKDVCKYGFFTRVTNFCAPCGLTVNTACVIYCLENSVPYYATGLNALQGSKDYGQSLLAINNLVKWLYEFGIELLLPSYQMRKTDEQLFKLGITSQPDIQSNRTIFTGYPFLHPTQGTCPLPLIHTLYRIGVGNPIFGTGRAMEVLQKYTQEKWNTVCKNYIKEYFQKKGLSINDLIKKFDKEFSNITIGEINAPKRIIMDDIGLSVVIVGLLLGALVIKMTGNIKIGFLVFLFIWCFFIYNHMAIRTKFKGEKRSFIFKN